MKKVRFIGMKKKNVHITQAKFIIPIFEASIYNSEYKQLSLYTQKFLEVLFSYLSFFVSFFFTSFLYISLLLYSVCFRHLVQLVHQSVWDSIKRNKQEKKNWHQKGLKKVVPSELLFCFFLRSTFICSNNEGSGRIY